MRKKITTTLLALTAVCVLSAQNEINPIDLQEVSVESSRAKIYPDAGRIITILEKSEIEKLAVHTLDELLDRVAGLDARQRGTGGMQTDLSVRGGTFDQVLVLLNGVNITDPQTGHYNLDVPVELSDVSRVEILQGSAARMYGPNAFSGAINIITGEAEKNQLTTRQSAGSYGALGQSLSGNYRSGQWQVFGAASYRQSDGFIKNTDYKTTNAFWQAKVSAKQAGYFRFQLAAQLKDFGANSFYTPLLPNQFESTKTFFSSLEWNYERNFYTFNTQLYWREHFDKFNFNRYAPVTKANYHKSDIAGGKFTVHLDWKKYGKTTLGIDARNEHIFSNNLGVLMPEPLRVPLEKDTVYYTKKDNRLITTAVLDHTVDVGKWNFAGGLSSTFNEQFGTHVNSGADIAYKVNNSLRVFTALNTAVRFPTFTDLYYSDRDKEGNLDLKPEKSITWELGAKAAAGRLTADAVVYFRRGNNVIDWVKMAANEKYQARNLTKINAAGADVSAVYQFNGSFLQSINAAYSFLHLDKKADGYDSKYALDYLKNKIVLGLNHQIYGKLSAHWNLSCYDRAGSYIDFVTRQVVDYQPYTLLNTRLMWSAKRVAVYLDINNILNQKYVEFGGLKQPEANFMAGLRLSI